MTRAEKQSWLNRLKESAQKLSIELQALALAYKDPRTPWYARVWAALVLAYAVSPVDLVPDFIPILGYLDDLVLLPAGIWVALKLIPPGVMAEAREKARSASGASSGKKTLGFLLVVVLWMTLLGILFSIFYALLRKN